MVSCREPAPAGFLNARVCRVSDGSLLFVGGSECFPHQPSEGGVSGEKWGGGGEKGRTMVGHLEVP